SIPEHPPDGGFFGLVKRLTRTGWYCWFDFVRTACLQSCKSLPSKGEPVQQLTIRDAAMCLDPAPYSEQVLPLFPNKPKGGEQPPVAQETIADDQSVAKACGKEHTAVDRG